MDTEPPGLLFFSALDFSQITSSILLVVLLAGSALISGAEVAFFSLSPSDFDTNQEKSIAKKLGIVQRLLSKPKKLLATILVANNFLNIAIVLLFESLSSIWFARWNYSLDLYYFEVSVVFLLKVVVVTFLILLFGEILPKIYANRNRISFAVFMAQPLNVLDTLLSPISLPMRSATLFLHDRYGKPKSNISVDHLSQAHDRAYAALERIHLPGGFYRRDIGYRALPRK